jgi:GT2 family glycosyltransferase
MGGAAYKASLKPGLVDTVALGTFRREVLERVGLYDERLTRNQDNELHARMKKLGYKVVYDPRIVMYYRNKATLDALLRHGYRTAKWNIYTLALHPYTWKARRFVPMAFVGYLAGLAAAALLRPAWARAAAPPLALYALLTAIFSLRGGRSLAERGRIAATFVTYHLAYGLGPFVGIMDLMTGRWRERLGRPLR